MTRIVSLALFAVLCISLPADAGIFKRIQERRSGSCASGSCDSATTSPNGAGIQVVSGQQMVCEAGVCKLVPAETVSVRPIAAIPLTQTHTPSSITIDGKVYNLTPVVPKF